MISKQSNILVQNIVNNFKIKVTMSKNTKTDKHNPIIRHRQTFKNHGSLLFSFPSLSERQGDRHKHPRTPTTAGPGPGGSQRLQLKRPSCLGRHLLLTRGTTAGITQESLRHSVSALQHVNSGSRSERQVKESFGVL